MACRRRCIQVPSAARQAVDACDEFVPCGAYGAVTKRHNNVRIRPQPEAARHVLYACLVRDDDDGSPYPPLGKSLQDPWPAQVGQMRIQDDELEVGGHRPRNPFLAMTDKAEIDILIQKGSAQPRPPDRRQPR